MPTWKDLKKSFTAIPEDELSIIDNLSYLQAERIRRGISQQELAQRINMSKSQLAKIERLDSTPSLKTLNRYANGLGLSLKRKRQYIMIPENKSIKLNFNSDVLNLIHQQAKIDGKDDAELMKDAILEHLSDSLDYHEAIQNMRKSHHQTISRLDVKKILNLN